MRSSSYFSIGSTHAVCQDYATHGNVADGPLTHLAYAFVSDGCSGSPNTDFGSRFMCQGFRWALERNHEAATAFVEAIVGSTADSVATDARPYVEGLTITALAHASQMVSSVLLPTESLDATLLGLLEIDYPERGVLAFALGDGAIVGVQDSEGSGDVTAINFGSGYPAYPNYVTDVERLRNYTKAVGDGVGDVDQYSLGFPETKIRSSHSFFQSGTLNYHPFIRFYPRSKYRHVTVFSDGVFSFHAHVKEGTYKAPVGVSGADPLRELVAYKSTFGDYVQRRAQKYLGTIRKNESIYHHDDLAMASVILQEES